MNNKPLNPKIYSIVFVVMFFLILLAQLFVPDFDVKTISGNYLWRKNFISGYNTFKYEIGDRLFSLAVIGKDGGFYYTRDTSIQDFQKTSPINVSKMKRLNNFFDKINNNISSYGGALLIVIPPNKNTIYPQFMPDEIPVLGEISSLDRLIDYLNKNSDIQILDLRPALISARVSSQVYYKTDTHWNCQGAFYAYDAILNKLNNNYPQLQPQPISNFDIIFSENKTLDIPRLLGIDVQESLQTIIPKFPVNDSVGNLPSLTVFHDSFYVACLNHYLEIAFKDITAIPYSEVHVEEYLHIIETEKPDIVIIEFVERYIEYFLSTIHD